MYVSTGSGSARTMASGATIPADWVPIAFAPGRVFADVDEWVASAVAMAPPLSDAQCALIRWALAPAVEVLLARPVEASAELGVSSPPGGSSASGLAA